MNTGLSNQVYELTISNQTTEMLNVEKWLAALTEKPGLSPRTGFALDLVLNEALINTIFYGYDDKGEHKIHISIKDSPEDLEVEITDDARPFNPLDVKPTEAAQTLEEASIGGRGILLMKEYCNELNYCYSGQQNHLLLSINKE